jgi:hypothetical protein
MNQYFTFVGHVRALHYSLLNCQMFSSYKIEIASLLRTHSVVYKISLVIAQKLVDKGFIGERVVDLCSVYEICGNLSIVGQVDEPLEITFCLIAKFQSFVFHPGFEQWTEPEGEMLFHPKLRVLDKLISFLFGHR